MNFSFSAPNLQPIVFVMDAFREIKKNGEIKIQNDRSNASDVLSPYVVNIIVLHGVTNG